jgi:hypothetical protein
MVDKGVAVVIITLQMMGVLGVSVALDICSTPFYMLTKRVLVFV